MSEHTPGPWTARFGRDDTNKRHWTLIHPHAGEAECVLAVVHTILEQDLQLMSAAPDLLAACEALIDGPHTDDTFAVSYLAAKLAVAKARGELTP